MSKIIEEKSLNNSLEELSNNEIIEEKSLNNSFEELSNNEINEQSENNYSIFDDVKLPIDKYKNIYKPLNNINEIFIKLNYEKQKDADKIEKKILVLLNLYREININYSIFLNKALVDIKKNIKLEKKKKKENKDKSKYFVNIPKNAPPFILDLLNKNHDEKVSQTQVLTAIIQIIKKCINNSHSTYAVFKESGKPDRTKFKIKEELLDLFNKIKDEAKKRNHEIEIPEIMGYPNLMSYMQYFIYKN